MTDREREFTFTDFFLLLKHRVRVIFGCAIILAVLMTFAALAGSPIYEAQGMVQISSGTNSLGMISEYFNLGQGNTQVNSEVEIFRSQSIAYAVVSQCSLNIAITDATFSDPVSRSFNFVLRDRLKRGLRTLRVGDVVFPDASINKKFYLSVTDTAGGFSVSGPGGKNLGSGQVGAVYSSDDLTFTVVSMIGPTGTRFRLVPADPYVTLKNYRENLTATALGGPIGTNLVHVSFRANNPTLASDVVNAIIAEYEKSNLEWLTSTGNSQTEGLQSRLDEASSQLHDAEYALTDYKNLHSVVALPEEARLAVTELSTREAEKVDLNLKLSLWQSVYSSLAAQLNGDAFLIPPVLTNDPIIEQLASDHARVTLEIQDLLLDYTESHPLVIAKKENLQSVRQNILDTMSATITGYRGQLGDIDSVIGTLEDRMYAIPDVERDLLELTRNVDVSQELYILLSKRLEEARLVESSLKIGNRIIDNATPPLRPVAPSIRKNLLMGLGLGLIFGIFLAFLIEISDSRLRRPEQLLRYLNGSPAFSIRRRSTEEISKAASTFALAVLKCRDDKKPVSIALVCPGPESGHIREILEQVISELSQGIHPIFMVDTSTGQKDGFFRTGMSPGISDISGRKEMQLQSAENGRIRVLPPGADPSGAYITSPVVRDFVGNNVNQAALGLFHVPNFVNDPVLRGWTSMACGAILILHRNHDLLQDIFQSLEAFESDNTRLLATIFID
ncbi:MAG: Wzz/FepE/Etk N-terminal domain-containing protein [bacterium]|nr:Wzz/FepE/Etk N-terminal domain-containing protein [bacterium]